MIKTIFADGKNPFRPVKRVAPTVSRHDVCNFVRIKPHPVTVSEVSEYFALPPTNIGKMLGKLQKDGAISRTSHNPPEGKKHFRYSFVKESTPVQADRIGPILRHLAGHPFSPLSELCKVTGATTQQIASVMHFAVNRSGTVLSKKIDGRLVYWAAP
jgi:hypothetical protein